MLVEIDNLVAGTERGSLQWIYDRYTALNPDVTNTVLDGNEAIVKTAMQELLAARNARSAVWDGLQALVMEEHSNMGLDE